MHRRPIVLGLLALLTALVLVPLALLSLAGTPAITDRSDSSERPVDGAAGLAPAEIRWSFATFEDDGADAFTLRAGTLANAEPVIEFEVPFVTLGFEDAGRSPVVAAPVRDRVVYVADDGAISQVRVVDIGANDAPGRVVAELDLVVWELVVDAHNDVAYLAALRRDGEDAGVIRVALDGAEPPRRIMEPVPLHSQGIVLAAVLPLGGLSLVDIRLQLSVDGRHLLRHACRLSVCADDVIDLATGDLQPVGNRTIIGIADGTIYHHACGHAGCMAMAIDFGVGREREVTPLERDSYLTTVRGRPVLVRESDLRPDGNALAIELFDLRAGRSIELFRVPVGESVSLHPLRSVQGPALTVPDGVVLVRLVTRDGPRLVAVSVGSGEWIEVESPPEAPPLGIAD